MTKCCDNVLVKFVLTHEDAKLPSYAKDGDAGADVYAVPGSQRSIEEAYMAPPDYYDEKANKVSEINPGDYIIRKGETVLVDLGFRMELPSGWEMQVRSRSGLAKRGLVVANSPGTIDSGYRGPCMVLLHNNSRFTRVIKPGTRVAQFVLKSAPRGHFKVVDELSNSERGEGGFGSTGTE